jgi:hypothetical protein
MAAQRKRTIWLYRIADDGRRLLPVAKRADIVALWRTFLATLLSEAGIIPGFIA